MSSNACGTLPGSSAMTGAAIWLPSAKLSRHSRSTGLKVVNFSNSPTSLPAGRSSIQRRPAPEQRPSTHHGHPTIFRIVTDQPSFNGDHLQHSSIICWFFPTTLHSFIHHYSPGSAGLFCVASKNMDAAMSCQVTRGLSARSAFRGKRRMASNPAGKGNQESNFYLRSRRRSRISASRASSRVGAGAFSGVAASWRRRRLMTRTSRNTAKATITKLTTSLRNTP